jgi:hypothetical protein
MKTVSAKSTVDNSALSKSELSITIMQAEKFGSDLDVFLRA